MKRQMRIWTTGILAGFISEAFMGLIFTSQAINGLLYDPKLQSEKFIEITSSREVSLPTTIIGMILLSGIHSWLFSILQESIPGQTKLKQGLFFGLMIWLVYWLFQEWFVYHTMLGEPIILTLLELVILLIGSLIEGIIISFLISGINLKNTKT